MAKYEYVDSSVRCVYGKGRNTNVLRVWHLGRHMTQTFVPAETFRMTDARVVRVEDLYKVYREADADADAENVSVVRCADGNARLRLTSSGAYVPRVYDERGFYETFVIPRMVDAEWRDTDGTSVDYHTARVNGHHIRFEYVVGLSVSGGAAPAPRAKKARTTRRRGGRNH